MRKIFFLSIALLLVSLANSTGWAQAKPLVGEVTAVNADKIALKTADSSVDVQLLSSTEYKRVPPENPKISAAVASKLDEVGVGDKIVVTGTMSADMKSISAKAVYLMTKADISKRLTSEQEAWRTRSISGRVTAVNTEMKQFTVAARGAGGEQNIVVSPKLNVQYRRYAPDSVKFDDAKTSKFEEIKVGDQVRVLGDKSEDGANFRAERVVAGSFKTIGGMITAIDAANNKVTIKDIQTEKPITVTVNANSVLKKFPAEFAQMMSMRTQGGAGAQPPTAGGNPGGTRPPQAVGQGQTPPNGAGQGGGMRGGRGEFDDMLERFPTITLADLKVGDAIAFSSSTGTDASKATAIKLVAGVEPFFRARQAGGRRNTGGGTDPGFSIPGLDGGGIGTP